MDAHKPVGRTHELLSKIKVGDLLRVKNAYTRKDVFGLPQRRKRAIIDVNPQTPQRHRPTRRRMQG